MPKYSTTEELIGLGANTAEAEKDQVLSQRLNDFKDTFGTAHGRRVLLAILANTFQHDSPNTGNSATYYNIGILDYARSILDVVALADPETFLWIHQQRAQYLTRKYEDRIIESGK